MTANLDTRFADPRLAGAETASLGELQKIADLVGAADVNDLLDEIGAPRLGITASTESLDAAREIQRTSGRRVDAPVRKSFVRSDGDAIPPLAGLYTGGRGGMVAIKLYLALIWRSGGSGYATDKTARGWATLLDLDDPGNRGARRVKAAMKTLQARGLIVVEAQAGRPNRVTLLDEGGAGLPYDLPSSAYSKAKARGAVAARLQQDLYFKLPTRLWTEGYLQTLRGPGLVMLLILLTEKAGQGQQVWISPAAFADRYNISRSTRTAGTKELLQLRLLEIDRQPLAPRPNASVFEPLRARNVYRLKYVAQESSRGEDK